MKRLLLGMCSALLVTLASVPTHATNLNDFVITNYDIRYKLSKDSEKRSVLSTTETIQAQFPDRDQNHGIERAIPQKYDGHSVRLDVQSVKKTDGSDWNYETRSDEAGNTVIRIGDADKYVRGQQTYVITYAQRDVTKTFNDTGDEFYWDTNGTDWNVPIQKLNVTLNVDDALVPRLANEVSCYVGAKGSTDRCQLSRSGNSYVVSETGLRPGDNVTIAVRFKSDTFGAYQQSAWDKIVAGYFVLLAITSLISVGIIVWILVKYFRRSERKHERGTIIAEYVPPKDTSVTTAASLLSVTGPAFSAQLLDFAVRGYLKVYQTREKSMFKSAEYDVEIVKDISGLKDEEQEILRDIFDSSVAVGARLKLKDMKNNTKLYNRTLDNSKKLDILIRGEYDLRHKDEEGRRWFKKTGFILLGISILLLSPGLFLAANISFISAFTLWTLTDKGLALSRYLEGLKLYIKIAETDRIRMLQSPDGAEKVGGIDVADDAQLVKLYEKVLPYAVLFGQEREWTKRLGDIYQSTGYNPAWYASNSAFNAAMFSSAIGNFSTAASYSAASSSSSGGSGGGGFSGGGGGGGGGGGW